MIRVVSLRKADNEIYPHFELKYIDIARKKKEEAAILAKAFRGELVPTEAELARREGRSYESATDLLARIRLERADQKQSSPLQKIRESHSLD